jgi:translocation and assembly module TamA
MTSIWASTFSFRLSIAVLLLAVVSGSAAEVTFDVSGVSDPLLANIKSHVQAFSIERQSDVSDHDFDAILSDAIRDSRAALRPYGYYHPEINGTVTTKDDGDPLVRLRIQAGPPILVDQVNVQVSGSGETRSEFKDWHQSWPLKSGQVLDQTVWKERKQAALNLARKVGYLSAKFVDSRLELDLDRHRANLSLIFETGERYLFGNIELGEHILKPGIVEFIPRFKPGDPYSQNLLNKYRMDLWKSGYFTEVVVEEFPRAEANPPVVDLRVRFETETRNTYQGSLGAGSDTGMRLQAQWSRHPMSSRGDRLDVGVGWQERDDEYSLRGTYRLPRPNRARQFWTSDLIIKHENLDFVVRPSLDEDFVKIANGTSDERHLRVGRLKVRNFKSGEQQALETIFVQGLSADGEFQALDPTVSLMPASIDPELQQLLRGSAKTLSVGFDYDLVAVYGKGWETKGHRERAWVFGSSESFGSDRNFTQAYVSTRRSYVRGARWKFIVRAEAGYTDARVVDYNYNFGGTILPLSVTTLPNFYRFNAGGSNSVRGYGFEELSNNDVGSNHIATASAELEMKFLENWSAALFIDIGNAFNNWSDPELKKGVGLGVRWYSIAGPIRIDVAQALDLADKPWRIHFTIGTPLL